MNRTTTDVRELELGISRHRARGHTGRTTGLGDGSSWRLGAELGDLRGGKRQIIIIRSRPVGDFGLHGESLSNLDDTEIVSLIGVVHI